MVSELTPQQPFEVEEVEEDKPMKK